MKMEHFEKVQVFFILEKSIFFKEKIISFEKFQPATVNTRYDNNNTQHLLRQNWDIKIF